MRINKNTKSYNITLDRFEGNFAVCETEDKVMIDVPRSLLPDGAHEGAMYALGLTPLNKEEEERRKRINEKAINLWAD